MTAAAVVGVVAVVVVKRFCRNMRAQSYCPWFDCRSIAVGPLDRSTAGAGT